MKPSVILIGAPGVGKTRLGQIAAKSEKYRFVDGDWAMIRYILDRGEIPSADPVAEKLKELGDERFLDFEHKFYLHRFPEGLKTATKIWVILSASGSMPLVPKTVEHFKETGAHFVWITRDTDQIVKNCKKRADGVTRVVGMEEHGSLDAVISYRMEIYRKCADSVLDLGAIHTKQESITAMTAHLKKIR